MKLRLAKASQLSWSCGLAKLGNIITHVVLLISQLHDVWGEVNAK